MGLRDDEGTINSNLRTPISNAKKRCDALIPDSELRKLIRA